MAVAPLFAKAWLIARTMFLGDSADVVIAEIKAQIVADVALVYPDSPSSTVEVILSSLLRHQTSDGGEYRAVFSIVVDVPSPPPPPETAFTFCSSGRVLNRAGGPINAAPVLIGEVII